LSLSADSRVWRPAFQGGEFAKADRNELITLFNYLEFCLEQVGELSLGLKPLNL